MTRTIETTGSGGTVLVVDGPKGAELLRVALRHAGYRVVGAESPAAALAALANGGIDLVLIDQSMLALFGDRLMQRIRAVDDGVPVMLHTGCSPAPRHSNGRTGERRRTHGYEQLLLWVASALRTGRANGGARPPAEGPDELLRRVSPNLRTPLQRIGGYTDLLLDGSYGELPAAARAPLLSLARTAHDLTRLLTNVLTHTRLAAGALTIERRRVGVDELEAQLRALADTLLNGRPVEFAVETAHAPAALYTDLQALRAILTNLIDNAARHTAAGRITFTVAREDGDAFLTVADTGSGIAASDLARLFQPFAGDPSAGLGLGLALSRELAERLGGELSASSRPGVGSVFTLVLRGVIPNGDVRSYFRSWNDDVPMARPE